MTNSIQFTNREEELMNFLWEYGKPATSNEMLEYCVSRTWSDSYLHVMLRSLERKGAIEHCGLVQYGTQYARQFRTCLTKEQYYVQLAEERGVEKGSFVQFAVAMAQKIKPDEKEELIHTLEEFIKELENSDEE